MRCEVSIVDAKAEFVLAVRRGIETLMTRRGYSRERAINALLREFNRGAETSEGRHNDEDVSVSCFMGSMVSCRFAQV
jgi:hypothetical protein